MPTFKTTINFLIILLFVVIGHGHSQESVEREVSELERKVGTFKVVNLENASGRMEVSNEVGLTIDKLRNIPLSADPPRLEKKARYTGKMSDGLGSNRRRPFVAEGILPFRLNHFSCEFMYGGWHNFEMQDYAITHGFDHLYAYGRQSAQLQTGFPPNTQLVKPYFFSWPGWMKKNGIPKGRYDLLADMDLKQVLINQIKIPKPKLNEVKFTIDLEHPVLSWQKLQQSEWYLNALHKEKFAERYYRGYRKTFTDFVAALKQLGWRSVGVYGWAPYGRTWGGLEKPAVDLGMNKAWELFGNSIYDSVDVIHNSVYCFYWNPKHVAFILANIDRNRERIEQLPIKKPIRPYYWTLTHPGGSGWRWWSEQPETNEDQRASIAMSFFAGIDGVAVWNAAGETSHHVPSWRDYRGKNSAKRELQVKSPFRMEINPPGGNYEVFKRYDFLHILKEANGTIKFQKIRPAAENSGVSSEFPAFNAKFENIKQFLRARSEPVSAVIEGLALIKPLEFSLRTGKVEIDVPADQQFQQTLPVVRRVSNGQYQIVATYDPEVTRGKVAREIELENFAGKSGLTLVLPADEQVRIFVFKM